jgi:hypothetical protein
LIEVVKLFEELNLVSSVSQLLVRLVRESEEGLTGMALVKSLLDNLVLLSLGLESFKGFVGLKTRLLRSILLELISKFINICDKLLSVFLKSSFEFRLLNVHLVTNDISLLDKTVPLLLDEILTVKFFLR